VAIVGGVMLFGTDGHLRHKQSKGELGEDRGRRHPAHVSVEDESNATSAARASTTPPQPSE